MKSFAVSLAVLATGFAAIGLLMFASVASAEAHNKNTTGAKLEVAINADGRALVRGAEVTSISGDTIAARTEWGATALAWTVRADDAEFVDKNGSRSDAGDISVGDYVSFSGSLEEDGNAFVVDADVVRNWSVDTDKDDRPRDRDEVRADVKAEAKGNWGDWMKRMPVFSWFGGTHDNR